jgi:hypothetical protein
VSALVVGRSIDDGQGAVPARFERRVTVVPPLHDILASNHVTLSQLWVAV